METFYAIADKNNKIIDIFNTEFTSKQPAIFRSKDAAKMHINRIRDTENSMATFKIIEVEV